MVLKVVDEHWSTNSQDELEPLIQHGSLA